MMDLTDDASEANRSRDQLHRHQQIVSRRRYQCVYVGDFPHHLCCTLWCIVAMTGCLLVIEIKLCKGVQTTMRMLENGVKSPKGQTWKEIQELFAISNVNRGVEGRGHGSLHSIIRAGMEGRNCIFQSRKLLLHLCYTFLC
jgi:hypothetical protein